MVNPDSGADHLVIRGRALRLDELFSADVRLMDDVSAQHKIFCHNKPFEHIIFDGLFNEQLLSLVEEEFPGGGKEGWRHVSGRHESTFRSKRASDLGPAAQTYFNLVNSNAFVSYLSRITGIPDLITDHTLLGGGLHETRVEGRFAVHRDFNLHHETMLANTLVFLTYLNRDWSPEYGGALELWDHERWEKVVDIAPIFGRSVLFRHSSRSFHGHPAPLRVPAGRSRRSLATYYYTNDLAHHRRLNWQSTLFLEQTRERSLLMQATSSLADLRAMKVTDRLKYVARGITPPILWWSIRGLRNSFQRQQH